MNRSRTPKGLRGEMVRRMSRISDGVRTRTGTSKGEVESPAGPEGLPIVFQEQAMAAGSRVPRAKRAANEVSLDLDDGAC